MARGGLPTNVEALAAENFALRLQLETVQQQLAMALDEVGKLRLITNSLLTRQAALLEQLRSAQAAGRQVSASVLGAALSAALERAAGSMENRTISRARAQIRAMLQIEDGEPGLVIGDPRIAESASLSTLTLDLLPVSPTLAQLAMQSALARVQNRLLRLQDALARTIAPRAPAALATALAETSLLLTDPPPPAAIGSRFAALTDALMQFSEWLPDIAAPARELEDCRAALVSVVSEAGVSALAQAIEAVAVAAESGQNR